MQQEEPIHPTILWLRYLGFEEEGAGLGSPREAHAFEGRYLVTQGDPNAGPVTLRAELAAAFQGRALPAGVTGLQWAAFSLEEIVAAPYTGARGDYAMRFRLVFHGTQEG